WHHPFSQASLSLRFAVRYRKSPRQRRDGRRTLHLFAGQFAGLLHPGDELRLVEGVVLVDIEIADLLLLGPAGRLGLQRSATEEGNLHVSGEAVKAHEPALPLDTVERRVPLDGF